MKVEELMNKSAVTVSPEESVRCAAELMRRYNVGVLPVCAHGGRLRGVVTDRDIVLRSVAGEGEASDTPVSEIMTRAAVTVSPEEDVADAAARMRENRVRRVPVVQDGRVVGVLSLGDLARQRECAVEAARALTEICGNLRRL